MDDCLDSVSSTKKALRLYYELLELWSKANMVAAKWGSNEKKVLNQIPTKMRAKEITLGEELKTLGLRWNAEYDIFKFKTLEFGEEITKREFLKYVAAVFDPMGFLAPVVLRAKMIIQEMWLKKLDWDETTDIELQEKIRNWTKDLKIVEKLEIPRCFKVGKESLDQVYVFVDASEDGYAAVAYNVFDSYVKMSEYEGIMDQKKDELVKRKMGKLIACKTKVAPLTSMSIPRLELLAAELGVKLASHITEALGTDMDTVQFRTDSKDVLGWLSNRSRMFQPFIAHRVGKIQEVTKNSQWAYIPSKQNPADLASRGQTMVEFRENKEWFEREMENVTESCTEMGELRELRSKKPNVYLNVGVKDRENDWRLNEDRFSNLTKLVRVRGWVSRFIHNCRSSEKRKGELSKFEFETNFLDLIRKCQNEEYGDEVDALKQKRRVRGDSSLSALNPFIDNDFILRANSRIQYCQLLNYDSRFPILLPKMEH